MSGLFYFLAQAAALFFQVLLSPLRLRRRSGRVLLIPEFGEFGGTRTYFKCLVRFCKEEGLDVVAALEQKLADPEILEFLGAYGCRYTTFNPSRLQVSSRKLNFILAYILRFAACVRLCLSENPSLVVFSAGQFVHLPAFLLPVRILYILHVYPDQRLFAHERGILRYALSREKRILTVSRFARGAVLKYWIDNPQKAGFVSLLCPVQYSWFDCGPPGEHSGKRTVLTLGHVAWTKDPETWIKVARSVIARHAEIEFIWAGGGYLTDEYLNDCRARTADEPRIRFAGLVRNPERLYDECAVYFQPSAVESYGLSVAEAMRRGIPCVVSDAGGLVELVSENTGAVVPAGSVNDMADAILLLLVNPAIRKERGAAARRFFEEHASVPVWQEQMRATVREMLDLQ